MAASDHLANEGEGEGRGEREKKVENNKRHTSFLVLASLTFEKNGDAREERMNIGTERSSGEKETRSLTIIIIVCTTPFSDKSD